MNSLDWFSDQVWQIIRPHAYSQCNDAPLCQGFGRQKEGKMKCLFDACILPCWGVWHNDLIEITWGCRKKLNLIPSIHYVSPSTGPWLHNSDPVSPRPLSLGDHQTVVIITLALTPSSLLLILHLKPFSFSLSWRPWVSVWQFFVFWYHHVLSPMPATAGPATATLVSAFLEVRPAVVTAAFLGYFKLWRGSSFTWL